jgi:hypothetical protein
MAWSEVVRAWSEDGPSMVRAWSRTLKNETSSLWLQVGWPIPQPRQDGNGGRRRNVHHLPRHEPAPIQSGCACRGDSGLAHIACLVQAAASQQAQRESDVWRQCQTCKQRYTGAMQTGLAEALRSRVAGQAAERDERLEAESNLALSLLHQGKDVEAGPMFRRLHEVMMRVLGAEHPGTLTTAGNLATSLSHKAFFS